MREQAGGAWAQVTLVGGDGGEDLGDSPLVRTGAARRDLNLLDKPGAQFGSQRQRIEQRVLPHGINQGRQPATRGTPRQRPSRRYRRR